VRKTKSAYCELLGWLFNSTGCAGLCTWLACNLLVFFIFISLYFTVRDRLCFRMMMMMMMMMMIMMIMMMMMMTTTTTMKMAY
jgi:hypothetical protein